MRNRKGATMKNSGPALSMQSAIARCKSRGVEVATVIDVGASDGRWSKDCKTIYTSANYLLVEAQQGHKAALEAYSNAEEGVDYILAAAGKKAGKIYFDASDLFGGLASEKPFEANNIEVPVVRLDDVIRDRNLSGPFLLKLDTHGYEIPILEGASELLEKASLVIIETYNFQLTRDSLRYWEMCAHMETLGFLPVENVDLKLRAKDQAFWQMDTFFVRKDSELFSYPHFK